MIIFVLTKEGFKDMKPLIETGRFPLWFNGGLLDQEEIDSQISEDLEVSSFNYVIDIEDEEALVGALLTVAEHHPNERIWSESRPKI